MQLITLNIWGGRVKEPLAEFFKKYNDVDIFLFQEIFESDKRKEEDGIDVCKALSKHVSYFAPAESNGFGLGAFVSNSLKVEETGDVFVHKHKDAMVGNDWTTIGKNLQYLTLTGSDGNLYTFFNLHGLWELAGKSDSDARIKQSNEIIKFIKKFKGNVILCGDFNLRPDTQSITMIEKELGLKNLITQYDIKNTRTSLYTRSEEKFADYIFVSPGVTIKDFKVLPEVVSDHAALFLEF